MMTTLEQINQDIQNLPQEALELLAEYVQTLKQMSFTSTQPDDTLQHDPDSSIEGSLYDRFQASGLIGCVSVEEHLSSTYKQVLAEGWGHKYDHR